MAPRSKSTKKRASGTSSKAKNNMVPIHETSSQIPAIASPLLVTPICTSYDRRGSACMSETSETSPISASSAISSSSVSSSTSTSISLNDDTLLESTSHRTPTQLKGNSCIPDISVKSLENHIDIQINANVLDTANASEKKNKTRIETSIVNAPLISKSLVEEQSYDIYSKSIEEQLPVEEATSILQTRMDNQTLEEQVISDSIIKESSTVDTVCSNQDSTTATSPTLMESEALTLNVQPTTIHEPSNCDKDVMLLKDSGYQNDEKLQLCSEKDVRFEQQVVEVVVPGMEPRNRQQSNRRNIPADITKPEAEDSYQGELCQSPSNSNLGLKGYMAKLRELEDASEKVVRDAIQCLVKDNDMELSYISILAVINVLSCRSDQESIVPTDIPDHILKLGQSMRREATEKTGRLYSKLLKIMTRSYIVDALSKETMQQDAISPEDLYLKLYNAIQGAGYNLQDQDHLNMCQYLLGSQCTDEALACLDRIDSKRWNSQIYRASITCHLFSKPRHLHEAGLILNKYLEYIKLSLHKFLGANKTNANLTLERSLREKEQENRAMIKKWFKLQLDASKWEEIVAQYERRRARLLHAPENIERFSATYTDSDPGLNNGSLHSITLQLSRRSSTVSSLSTSSSAFTIPQPEVAPKISTTSTQQPSQPNIPESTSMSSIMSPFTYISSLISSQRRNSSSSIATISSINTDTRTCSTQSQPSSTLSQTNVNLSHKYQISRYLSALDNGILEECINHKQFKYGWEQVYERMGSTLEDKDTVKIVMRLCKRAFLGHGGLRPNQPGSPNVLTNDICFEDEYSNQSIDDDAEGECSKDCNDDEDLEWSVIVSLLKEKELARRTNSLPAREIKQDDPEIWEARAWVIYNKAMTNPIFFGTNACSPTGSPTQSQQSPSNIGASHGHNGSTSTSALPPTVTTNVTGTSSLTVFLHNILTIAINSPEKSSRFLKAFRIYSTMRNDPLNQYQVQLRDPFVMTCMIKAIYDTVLTITRSQKRLQQQHERQESCGFQGSESNMDLQSEATLKQSIMSIGPLVDLAFEIYADMRNVGPIRYLPHLSALVPSSPTSNGQGIPNTSNGGGMTNPAPSGPIVGSMSMFFQLSSRPPAPPSSTVDLSACGSNVLLARSTARPAPPAPVFTGRYIGSTNKILSPTSTTSPVAVQPCIFQDLNPTLVQNVHARRIPSELYLALLHLCTQVPLSGIQQSFRVAKTIVADMMTIKLGQLPANLDRHLAAALQVYHDQWMCRPQELKGRKRSLECCNSGKKSADNSQAEETSDGCMFHRWMYQSEEYILKYITSTNVTADASRLISDLSDTPAVRATASSTAAKASLANTTSKSTMGEVIESSHYSISKRDADLDELDQYLKARAAVTGMDSSKSTEKQRDNGDSLADELDHDTCNDRWYWDLWSREDPALQNIRFSRRRARMLWRHVDSLNDM
ncbi:hypothetical protein BGZ76_008282 [Entomortierella beljakovae]|nr:hypothetical protein BGZ76_008282 [Entomortierella beljakovae]